MVVATSLFKPAEGGRPRVGGVGGRFGAWRYEVGNMDHSVAQGVAVVDGKANAVDSGAASELNNHAATIEAAAWEFADIESKLLKAEYKRRQAPPGVKITPRAFGRDWRLPLVRSAGAWGTQTRSSSGTAVMAISLGVSR